MEEPSAEKVKVLRMALRSEQCNLALRALPLLSVAAKKALLPELLHIARAAHGPFQVAWNAISSLPRNWLLKNIEKEAESILECNSETDYYMFLQLFSKLDVALHRRLAKRAAHNINLEIRALGAEAFEDAKVRAFSGPFAGLKFSVRITKRLQRMGITSVEELVQQRASDLLNGFNFGEVSLHEVRTKLAQIGQKLRPE
jgi:hypothetical protein